MKERGNAKKEAVHVRGISNGKCVTHGNFVYRLGRERKGENSRRKLLGNANRRRGS